MPGVWRDTGTGDLFRLLPPREGRRCELAVCVDGVRAVDGEVYPVDRQRIRDYWEPHDPEAWGWRAK